MSSARTNQVVAMPLKSTEFDFHGLEIVTYELKYFPFIETNCTEDMCDFSGYYPDLMQIIGKNFNFSVLHKQEPSGNWGTFTKLGKNTSSVLQKVHSGESAFTFPWSCISNRYTVFDCIAGGRWRAEMYMIENTVKVSIDMLLEPFTIEAWALIILYMSTITIVYKL